MLRNILLALTLAMTTYGATVSYSPPVGGSQITFTQGKRFSGMPFINPAAQLGVISGNTTQVITLSDTSVNMSTALVTGTAYYAEITAGPDVTYVGDRFEVDATGTIASANNTITITPDASTNTMASLPASLDGYTVTIRPHVTLGQLFGTKANELMHGSANLSTADQVAFFNPQTQSYLTYYYLRNPSGTFAQWSLVGGGATNRDNTPIPPGVGFIVQRNDATPVTLTWSGAIRRNSFAQPLAAGLNLVAESVPVSSSPLDRTLTYANGIQGSANLSTADQVSIYNGTGYSTYYLLRNPSGTFEQWTLVGGGSTNQNNTKIFTPTGAVFIRKILADPHYLAPYTLSL